MTRAENVLYLYTTKRANTKGQVFPTHETPFTLQRFFHTVGFVEVIYFRLRALPPRRTTLAPDDCTGGFISEIECLGRLAPSAFLLLIANTARQHVTGYSRVYVTSYSQHRHSVVVHSVLR